MNFFNVVESNANQHEVYEILQQSLRRLLLEMKYLFYWFNLVIYVKELLIFFLWFINISACDHFHHLIISLIQIKLPVNFFSHYEDEITDFTFSIFERHYQGKAPIQSQLAIKKLD